MSVTMLDTSSWTPAERQAAARDAYRASGHRLTGAELGRRFGRSGRWGRAQIQAVATEDRAAAGGGHGRDGGSPAAVTDKAVRSDQTAVAATGEPAATTHRPMATTRAAAAAAGNADAPGTPSVAAGGSTATANRGPVAATGGGPADWHAGAAADIAVSGFAARVAAATRTSPDSRPRLTAATGSDAAEPEVPPAVR